jgi:transglutaminase-like putative cysteine protease
MLAVYVAALTVLGALILGLRHDAPWLPAAAAVAAVCAVIVTDRWGVVRLNRWLANAITIVAVAWSLRDFWDLSSEAKLMAIGSMLCLLQIVLLFQQKTARIYWHLVVLSVLEVVVAAALELGPSFVPLLTLFLAVGLGALTLLCVYRETARARTGNWELAKWVAKQWQAFMGRALPRTRTTAADSAGATGIRNALERRVDSATAAQLLLARAVVESNRGDDAPLDQWFTTQIFVRQIVLLTIATMLFAVVFFYATPRLRDGFSPNGFFFGGPTMGFRSEVRLQRKGRIHLSSRPVMRVKLSRLLDQRSIELAGEDEPYFHGAILPEYVSDVEGSRWVRPQSSGRGIIRAVSQTTRSLVRQDIVVEPNVSRRFAIQPTQPIEDATAVYGSGYGGSDRAQQQRYALATPAIVNERQVKAIPNPNRRRNEDEEAAFREELTATTRFPAERFPRLAEIAAQVLEQNQLQDGRSFDKAVALWRHFLVPGQYEYSLNLNISSDDAIDPIEDFVANSRSGNCEYFASALAMMLRSQDIPARLVRGYKCGTFNTVGRYYLVQERDAHSWVEAWMPTEAVSNELAGAPSDGGAWYRFDPTPGRSTKPLIEQPGMGERIAQAFDYVELLWRDYVLSLNTARQDEIVYDPLTARAGALPQWMEMRQVRGWLRRAGAVMGLDSLSRGGRPSRVFEGTIAVAVILALLFLAAAIYGARVAWAAITKRGELPRKAASTAPEFYRRLERLMARLPIVRRSTETPREMAVAAGERLAAFPGEAAIAALPGELVTAYYRVRFGKGRLDKVESEAIEQALKKIELAVQRVK